jgi:hypothetical protein
MVYAAEGIWRVQLAGGSFLVVFFVFLFFFVVLEEIAVLAGVFAFAIFILVVKVLGDEVQVYRMGLRDLQLGFTLRATEDLALFHFVFVDVDFGGTLRAADHS